MKADLSTVGGSEYSLDDLHANPEKTMVGMKLQLPAEGDKGKVHNKQK
jgi:hypothetical protein